jgi:hypothetical protein
MGKRMKLNLKKIKVQSFVTSLDEDQKLKITAGAAPAETNEGECPEPTEGPGVTQLLTACMQYCGMSQYCIPGGC